MPIVMAWAESYADVNKNATVTVSGGGSGVGHNALIEGRIGIANEVSLSIAGKQVLGTTGLVIVTIPAAFPTGSAINSTLFATARLGKVVADHDELPKSLAAIASTTLIAVFLRPCIIRISK